jgi:hypothetical protein
VAHEQQPYHGPAPAFPRPAYVCNPGAAQTPLAHGVLPPSTPPPTSGRKFIKLLRAPHEVCGRLCPMVTAQEHEGAHALCLQKGVQRLEVKSTAIRRGAQLGNLPGDEVSQVQGSEIRSAQLGRGAQGFEHSWHMP